MPKKIYRRFIGTIKDGRVHCKALEDGKRPDEFIEEDFLGFYDTFLVYKGETIDLLIPEILELIPEGDFFYSVTGRWDLNSISCKWGYRFRAIPEIVFIKIL